MMENFCEKKFDEILVSGFWSRVNLLFNTVMQNLLKIYTKEQLCR